MASKIQRENRALKFGIAFWIFVFLAVIWRMYIYPNPDLNLIYTTEWQLHWWALSPLFPIFLDVPMNHPVGHTNSILGGFAALAIIFVTWLPQFMILSFTPVVFYWKVEEYLSSN